MIRSKSFWFSVVFTALLAVCLWFVVWVSRLAFGNTCIELKEQYVENEAKDILEEISRNLRFGKSLEHYYGMDTVLDRLCSLAPGNIRAAVADGEGKPLYTSYEGEEEELELTALLFSDTFEESIKGMEEKPVKFSVRMGGNHAKHSYDLRIMALPIEGENGFVALFYNTDAFLADRGGSFAAPILILLVIGAGMMVYYAVSVKRNMKGRAAGGAKVAAAGGMSRKARWIPVAAVMAGVLVQIGFSYLDYQNRYEDMIYDNANEVSSHIVWKVEELLENGLKPEELKLLEEYFTEKALDSDVIWNISVVYPYMDTARILKREARDVIMTETKGGMASVLITVSRQFITGQMRQMIASFAAIFLICLMISYELVRLIDIVGLRLERRQGKEKDRGASRQELSFHIKLFSFFTYTAVYASMPYAAVLMRTWNASVFGLPPEVSASLPLTVELVGILFFSFLIPRLTKRLDSFLLAAMAITMLAAGNLGSGAAKGPVMLIGTRLVCSLGFALFKYFMNTMVAAGSGDEKELGANFAMLNAGLLGGITAGGAVGAVVAQAKGYQFNYAFTAGLIVVSGVIAAFLVPWAVIRRERKQAVEEAESSGIPLRRVLRNPSVVRLLVLGDIPLNIGLMYVVAFLPVYVNNMGYSSLTASYAYLINGFCGVYLGAYLIRPAGRLPGRVNMAAAMALSALGILALTTGGGIGMILLSAGLMGVFDGFGTPAVTGSFTSLPDVKRMDAAQMLTVFHIVGSAVQIICPLLYNVTIQENGKTTYLTALGFAFALVALLHLVLGGGMARRSRK